MADNPNVNQTEMGKSYQIFNELKQYGEAIALEIKRNHHQSKSSPQICNQFEKWEWWSLSCHHKSAHPSSLGILSLSNQGSLFYESSNVVEPDGQQYLLSFGLNNSQIQVILL